MVIDDFDFVRAGFPMEADAPLVIDSNTVLSGASTAQSLKPIARRSSHIMQVHSGVQLQEFAPGGSLNIGRQTP